MTHDVSDFYAQVLERSQKVPVLVDFWAAWCGPCRVIGPILERLAERAAGRWELAKLDTEAHPEVASRYDIMSIPAVKLFVGGQVVDEFVGALPEAQIERWLEKALPSPLAAEVDVAESLLERGDYAGVIPTLRDVVAREPGLMRARLLLGRALLHREPAAVAAAVEPALDDPESRDRAVALRALATVATLADAPERLPASDARERFLQGARAIRGADFAAAFEAFIDVLRTDRDYAEGAAATACRAMIVVLGLGHPAVDSHFRAFSSALHA